LLVPIAAKRRSGLIPSFVPQTTRWTNRPTFQQIIGFDSHGPR
jgi:hypothetical protein